MTDQSDKDDVVRRILAEHGDDPSRPRATAFFFYGGDLRGLAEAAVHEGFTADLHAGRPGMDDCLILSTSTALDENSFQDFNDLFGEWAEEFASRYDGWETELSLN